eukprot:COSAG05_NODE_48_length_24425_cov_90.438543_27_plen_81_part_00
MPKAPQNAQYGPIPPHTIRMHKNVTTIVVISNPRPTMSRSAYDRAIHVIPGLVGEFSATLRYSPYTLFCGLASNTSPLAH